MRTALALLGEAVLSPAPGQQTVLDRLLDLLLVYTLRAWFDGAGDRAPGWYAALGDPAIEPALRAVHARPEHPWTVQELAVWSA
jgi:hypothetical protein